MSKYFVGRQPIFDAGNELYAYQLLYRSGLTSEIGEINPSVATSRLVIDAFVEVGLENLVGDRRAFINIDHSFLLDPDLVCFPPDQVVLQLPATIAPTPETIGAMGALKARGHTLAISGYRQSLPAAQLLSGVDIVKIDTLDVDPVSLQTEAEALAGSDVTLIATRVESREQREQLGSLGFDCFQGHYLAKPQVVVGERLPANRMAVLQLVTTVSQPDVDFRELEGLIARDPGLSMRVLRFVNSPLSGLTNEVESIHQAAVLVGRNTIKNWVMLLALAGLDDLVPELVTTAFVRARLCEQLALRAGMGSEQSFFTVGLFSLMDAMMSKPMDELVDELPFTPEVKDALADRSGVRGEAISCAEALERDDYQQAGFQDVHAGDIAEIYLDAIKWTDRVLVTAG